MEAKQVSEIGTRLSQHARPNKDFLVKSLRQAGAALSKLEHNPLLESAIKLLSDYILKDVMLQYKDRDVKLLLGICFSEIMRILAPDPPFSDSHLRGIFEIIISIFSELADTTSPFFTKRVKILETVAQLNCCIIMLDIECEDLVLAMIKTFFSVVREHHQQNLVDAIVSIVTHILEGEVLQPFVDVILQNLLDEKKDTTPTASSRLSASVIQACSKKLEPFVCSFLISCISDRDAVQGELKKSYHDIIYKIYRCSPQMLLGVIPNLTQELMSTGSFFHDRSITLGSLIGISSILEFSRRSTRGRATEISRDKKGDKSKSWCFSLCSRLTTDAVAMKRNGPSLGHFLQVERKASNHYRRNHTQPIYGPDDFSQVVVPNPDANSLFDGDQVAPPHSNVYLDHVEDVHGATLLSSCLCGQLSH